MLKNFHVLQPQTFVFLTTIRHRSVAFVRRHFGSTGAKRKCFPGAPRLDIKVYGSNAHQIFQVLSCTICAAQLQNGPRN